MSTDPSPQLAAVTRTVTPAPTGNVVALAQTFPVPTTELWTAVTSPEHLGAWFGPASGELVEGGRFELPAMEARGSVLAVDAPHLLRLRWEDGGSRSEFELRLEPVEAAESGDEATDEERTAQAPGAPQRTRLTLRHTVPADAHWAAFGPGATGCGWDGALRGLALHLEDPAADVLALLAEEADSEAGRQFVRETADAWYAAHVASGADRKPARKAAVRTAAAYLGEEPTFS